MDVFESLAIDGKPITRIRRPVEGKPDPLDGYIDATMMCKAAGKEWSTYYRSERNQAYLTVLERVLQCCRTLLVHSRSTGPYEERGTWVHPRVATHLATWCSPEFDVAVHDLVDRFRNGDLKLLPQLLQNHDAVNNTVSRALVQTLNADADKRIRVTSTPSISHTLYNSFVSITI